MKNKNAIGHSKNTTHKYSNPSSFRTFIPFPEINFLLSNLYRPNFQAKQSNAIAQFGCHYVQNVAFHKIVCVNTVRTLLKTE